MNKICFNLEIERELSSFIIYFNRRLKQIKLKDKVMPVLIRFVKPFSNRKWRKRKKASE